LKKTAKRDRPEGTQCQEPGLYSAAFVVKNSLTVTDWVVKMFF